METQTAGLSFTTGICVPSYCSVKDVKEIAYLAFSQAKFNITSVTCDFDQPISFHIKIVAIVIFATLLLTVISSTIYELYMQHKESRLAI